MKDLPNFHNSKVLVIGDVMLDRYLIGDTSRISPEAPVPVVHVNQTKDCPGGAGNVALNVNSLGGKATLLGLVGKDEAAAIMLKALNTAKINCHLYTTDAPTISKLRVLSHNQQLIRLDFEDGFAQQYLQELLAIYKQQLPLHDIVIFSDYGKGLYKIVPDIIKLANKHKLLILIHPKGKDFSIYNNATLITPNFSEFTTIVGDCINEEAVEQQALKLVKKHKFKAILVTRGAKGMSLIKPKSKPLHIPTHAREVYDVTGAGDTVIATLGVALAAKLDLNTAVLFANTAASVAVKKIGAVAVTALELRRALQIHNDSWLGITSEDELLAEVQLAKANGETIVMTNGCFDILHAGHVTYLEQAHALGTRLIVAVNDDNSVKRLKGDNRPINSLDQRMAVLAGLRAIDWVVPFSEDTPERLISKILPHILVKGGDYKIEQIAGAKQVIQNGGEVKTLPFLDNHSTSSIIKKIGLTP